MFTCRQGCIESPCTRLMPTTLSDTASSTGSDIKNPAEKLRMVESTADMSPARQRASVCMCRGQGGCEGV